MKKVALISGGSKGIGKALASYYFRQGFQVFSLSRTMGDLDDAIIQLEVDLTSTKDLEKAFAIIQSKVDITVLEKITLINNAGRLGMVSNIENISAEDIATSIQLNVSATMQLSGLFIKAFQQTSAKKKIINISSGAAVSPYQGWSVYCASKAALDMFTLVVATEQSALENGVFIIGIRPGVVATNMQAQIRETDKNDFKLQQKFIDLHENNMLSDPMDVAEKIFIIDEKNIGPSGNTLDVRNLG